MAFNNFDCHYFKQECTMRCDPQIFYCLLMTDAVSP